MTLDFVHTAFARSGATPAQTWSPPTGSDVTLMEAGVHWDAVRLPACLGARVLARLGGQCGAVICDPYSQCLYFLIRTGAAESWRFAEDAHVRVLGTGSVVGVPPVHMHQAPGHHWARPIVAGRVLTRTRRLHAVMQAVIADVGPREVTSP